MLGRVISLVSSVMLLASPIGLLLAGPLVDEYGIQPWFFLGRRRYRADRRRSRLAIPEAAG